MNNSFPSLSITHMMYGWSKWGGGTQGLAKETLDEWYCQACGEEQIKGLPSYMIPVDTTRRDFVRVCASCKAKAISHQISLCFDLLRLLKEI
jgi:hypothetical protein